MDWTHKYKYILETSRYIDRVGYKHTGAIQVSREYSNYEVEALAKEMSHGTLNDAVLIKCELIETRTI